MVKYEQANQLTKLDTYEKKLFLYAVKWPSLAYYTRFCMHASGSQHALFLYVIFFTRTPIVPQDIFFHNFSTW